jgi:putative ATPase
MSGTPKNRASPENSLFPSDSAGPLADRMRPQSLEDMVGQDHILGPGRLLRRAIQADRLSSVIFYGPPGTGKTSLAKVIANTTKSVFESLNAVLAGLKDLREVLGRAEERLSLYGKRTILFVDEVHRWNRAQQDALLPWVEKGVVILIGATTQNPFFEVNRALVSRSRIFQLKALTSEDLRETAARALQDRARGYGNWRVSFEERALDHLVEVAGGDARSLLNALELAVETTPEVWPPPAGAEIYVSFSAAEESIQRRAVLYDRDGDYHFDTISAFIKSLRGSDPDAGLYWLAKMLRAGEDPAYLFRRMLILACEDVGLADPQGVSVVLACAQGFDRIGLPEGTLLLSQACLYLATAPKTNTALSFFDAMEAAEGEDLEVPNPLRDPSRDKEGFGHGDGYIYPHAYRDHWAAQQYLPGALRGKTFYHPSGSGYEGRLREEILRKREIQAAIVLGDGQDGEFLAWSGTGKGREGWFKRLESGRSAVFLADRDAVFGNSRFTRTDRTLIPGGNDGLLVWESLRRSPEGLTGVLTDSETAKEALMRYAALLEDLEKPVIGVFPDRGLPLPEEAERVFSTARFEHILGRNLWRKKAGALVFRDFAEQARNLLGPSGDVVLLQAPPVLGDRLSRVLGEAGGLEEEILGALASAEAAFFEVSGDSAGWTWDGAVLTEAFSGAGFRVTMEVLDRQEDRLILSREAQGWFDRAGSRWGAFMAETLGEGIFSAVRAALEERIAQGPVLWKWQSLLLTAEA